MLCTCILLLLTYTSVGRCFIEEIELPPSLRDCLRMKTKYQDVTKSPSESVCNTCVSRYLWMSGPNLQKCDHPNDNTTISDISNLFGKLLCEETSRKRTKRQTRYIPFRKELRMLTRAERQRLRRAWRRAYDSGDFGLVARFHNENIRTTSHNGPAFPGYHRFLLLILERVLQKYEPGITLPYWDTTFEANMDRPENSVLWTDEYLGELNGFVDSGICGGVRDLRGNRIIRNGGNDGSLFTWTNLTYIINVPTIEELVENSNFDTLESLHDSVHAYIGGTMLGLELAPWDCVFWFYHAYIDYVWELWRYSHGYNIAYPNKPNHRGQQANIQMTNMPAINFLGRIPTNQDGYGRELASQCQYQVSPTCSQQNVNCGSPDLQCRSFGRQLFGCTAVDRIFRNRVQPYILAANGGNVQITSNNGIRGNRVRRDTSAHHNYNTFTFTVKATDVANVYIPQEREPCMGKPVQNSFIAGCSSANVKRWAFIPIKVVHLRPKEVHFNSKTEVNGYRNKYDIYDEHKYKNLKNFVHPGNPATYYDCQEDESGAFKVRVKASGLNYYGAYTDYVFVDNRLPVSSHIGYIAVEKPTGYKQTEALITASDACGRLCKPTCRKWIDGEIHYVPCSGAIKVTADNPLMYGNDFGDAVLSVWQFKGKFTPVERESNIFMEFYCDYSDEWIWEECNSH